MDMPPLFSHNGVVGQTTSHLVASDHLSLNSLLSQSQSVYGHKGSLQNQPPGNQSHIATSVGSSGHGVVMQHQSSHQTRSRRQKTIPNEVQASGSSSLRDRKRLRDDSSSESDEDLEEQQATKLGKKKGISAPNIISPSSKSPKMKRAKIMHQPESKEGFDDPVKQPQMGKKKTVAFADDSTDKSTPSASIGQGDVSGPPKIILPRISELIKNSPPSMKTTPEEENQKPLLANPEAINLDRKKNEKRVKAMLANAFDESESDEDNESDKEKQQPDLVKPVIDTPAISKTTPSSVSSFKFGESTKITTSSVLSGEKQAVVKPIIENKKENSPAESIESVKDKTLILGETGTSTKEGLGAPKKLPEIPSTLQLLSQAPAVTSIATSVPSSSSVLQPATVSAANTVNSQSASTATSPTGFNFSFAGTKSPISVATSAKETTLTSSNTQKDTNISTFTFSAKPSNVTPPTTSVLSSQSVLTALSSPGFKSVLSSPNITVEPTKDSSKVSSPVASVTTTSSNSAGFNFSFGKTGVTSPISNPGISTEPPVLGQPPKSLTTMMPTGGFNFSTTPASSFSFGSDKAATTIGLTTTTPSLTSPVVSTSTTAAVDPLTSSNMFSFGPKNPPDVTSTKPSLTGASFSFGKVVSPTTTAAADTPNTGLFGFGAITTSSPSTVSSTTTGNIRFT